MALWKLNPMDFTKMNPTRQAKIEAAPAKELPPLASYKPNEISNALHPKAQYLKVVKVEEEAGNSKRYYLAPNPDKGTTALAWFSAGQYLSVTLKIGNMTLTRPYSLASSPREALDGIYMLTIQKVEGGLASQFIHDNWQVGTEVTVSEPLGHFTYEPLRDAKTVVGVVGGLFTATESAAIAVVYSLIVSVFIYKGITWKGVWQSLEKCVETLAIVLILIAMVLFFKEKPEDVGLPAFREADQSLDENDAAMEAEIAKRGFFYPYKLLFSEPKVVVFCLIYIFLERVS